MMPPRATPLRSSSAIFRLNSDILRRIFAFNAKEYTSLTRLETLRRASHVCSSWRDLILESPTLWSHAYDIGSLNCREEWQREVFERTGNCTLRVKVNKGTIVKMDKFIQSVLNEHWHRIRYLDIEFSYWCSPTVSWIPLLERSAPLLQTFRVTFHRRFPSALSSLLFANSAPSLRNFAGINVKWDPKTVSWAANIHQINITSFVSIVELLHSLLLTPLPNLEHLELAEVFDDETVPKTSVYRIDNVHMVNFPRLGRIKISLREEFETILSLLGSITPLADCTFKFLYTPITDVSVVHDQVQTVFSKYLSNIGGPESVNLACLSLNSFKFRFSLHRCTEEPIFQIGVDSGWRSIENSLSPFLPFLTTTRLDRVEELRLFLSLPDSEFLDASIEQFVTNASSVEELVTNASTLDWLRRIEARTGRKVFPGLKNIHYRES